MVYWALFLQIVLGMHWNLFDLWVYYLKYEFHVINGIYWLSAHADGVVELVMSVLVSSVPGLMGE